MKTNTIIGLVALLAVMFFLSHVGQEKKEQELEKIKALETVKDFAFFVKKNRIGFEQELRDERTGKILYEIEFVSSKKGVNLEIHHRNSGFKVHFVYTLSTDWDDVVVLRDQYGDYEIKERQFIGENEEYVLRGDSDVAFWRELNHHLTFIMEAKGNSNFIFQRKKLNIPQRNNFNMDEDFILKEMLNPEDD